MSNYRKKIENYYPIVISIILLIIVFCGSNQPIVRQIAKKAISYNILSLVITVETTVFGFLLAVLSIILQMNTKAIVEIKEANRYIDLIHFSKCAVYGAFFSAIFSLGITLIVDLLFVRNLFTYSILFIWGFTILYSFFSSMRFVNIFYILAKLN